MRLDGGGYMTGVVSADDGTTYARSDISGFYKRNEDGTWTQQLDYILPSEENLMGAAGIAISPTNSDVVYVAAGQSSSETGELLKTENGGRTWKKTAPEQGFYFGALEGGRTNGEPVAVSPHDENTVLVLTKTDGLWKTTDAAGTWSKVDSFTPAADKTTGFVEFSKTDADVIYVNVIGEGMYKTEDGGVSWELTADSPTNLRRAAQKADGTLFCSSSDGIYKYSTDGVWSKLFQLGTHGIGGIDIDPFDENHIVAISSTGADGTTGLGNNHIIESHDGGSTFVDRLADHVSTNNNYVNPSGFENVITSSSSIVFDATRQGVVFISEWFGIFEAEDLTQSPIVIYRNSEGIENTLSYTVKAMTGDYSVMAGFADMNSYGWTDIDAMGQKTSAASSKIQDTTEIDYCESNPDFVVRTGANHAENGVKYTGLEYSSDGGSTWTVVELDADIFGNTSAAHTAVSAGVGANGNPIILLSGIDGVYYTTDLGAEWQKADGAPSVYNRLYIYTSPIVSDRVLSKTFYMYSGGSFYYSGDGGKTFKSYENNGLPSSSANVQLETSPYNAGYILLTIKGSGVYLSKNYGSTFNKIGDFVSPKGAAFGKGKNDEEYVIYVYDSSDSVAGIYASTDEGNEWQKITHGTNNFCGMSDMDADKNEFGVVYIATTNRGVFSVEWK